MLFIGETVVNQEDTKYKNYTQFDWAMYFVETYGQIDGKHHKTWVLDQVSRIYNGTKPIISLAKWCNENGEYIEEYRISLDKPTQKYKDWVSRMKNEINGECEYEYDEGIAP